jgi:hypothetical protein
MKFAIDYYGIDNVMYGTDYPCWDPATCLKLIDEIGLSQTDRQKLFYDNARRILGLRDPVGPRQRRRRAPLWPDAGGAPSAVFDFASVLAPDYRRRRRMDRLSEIQLHRRP